jgi:WD40 repeat protein
MISTRMRLLLFDQCYQKRYRHARFCSPKMNCIAGPPSQHRGPVRRVAFAPGGDAILTGSEDGTARLWHIQPALQMKTEQIALWVAALTGLELDNTDTIQVLDAKSWEQRRWRLGKR